MLSRTPQKSVKQVSGEHYFFSLGNMSTTEFSALSQNTVAVVIVSLNSSLMKEVFVHIYLHLTRSDV